MIAITVHGRPATQSVANCSARSSPVRYGSTALSQPDSRAPKTTSSSSLSTSQAIGARRCDGGWGEMAAKSQGIVSRCCARGRRFKTADSGEPEGSPRTLSWSSPLTTETPARPPFSDALHRLALGRCVRRRARPGSSPSPSKREGPRPGAVARPGCLTMARTSPTGCGADLLYRVTLQVAHTEQSATAGEPQALGESTVVGYCYVRPPCTPARVTKALP